MARTQLRRDRTTSQEPLDATQDDVTMSQQDGLTTRTTGSSEPIVGRPLFFCGKSGYLGHIYQEALSSSTFALASKLTDTSKVCSLTPSSVCSTVASRSQLSLAANDDLRWPNPVACENDEQWTTRTVPAGNGRDASRWDEATRGTESRRDDRPRHGLGLRRMSNGRGSL